MKQFTVYTFVGHPETVQDSYQQLVMFGNDTDLALGKLTVNTNGVKIELIHRKYDQTVMAFNAPSIVFGVPILEMSKPDKLDLKECMVSTNPESVLFIERLTKKLMKELLIEARRNLEISSI